MSYRALARNPVSILGVWLTTLGSMAFVVYYLVEWFGLVASPYAGLFGFVLVPAVFLAGLILIPIGIWREGRRRRRGLAAWSWPAIDLNASHTRRIALAIALLTLVNLGIVSLAGLGAVHYMETNQFCGQVCHTPMRPETIGHDVGAHAGVDCVRCHVSPGAAGMVRAKWNGTRQAYLMVTGTFSRPIPSSPAHNIPVAADTCLRCHARGRSRPDFTMTSHEFDDDEENSDTPTTIVLYTDKNHWHQRADVKVEYVATDAKRETIPYVKVTRPSGEVREYFGKDVTSPPAGERRTMDCLDCHSRPAHAFSPAIERTVDDAMAAGRINTSLPFVHREVMAALKQKYATGAEAEAGIRRRLAAFYASNPAPPADVAQATETAVRLYRENVFPEMNVSWGTYVSQIGHTYAPGCQRCHDDEHTTKDGAKVLENDCDLCHKQLKED
jgi:hypothetical protein